MSVNFRDYDLVIFDLDNTLYDESLYLFKAYEEIAFYLSRRYSHLSAYEITIFLKNQFLANGREFLLDKLFATFRIKDEIKKCLEIMRTIKFREKISLTEKGKILLSEAVSQTKVIVLTNGNPKQQKNKIEQIDWGNFLDYVQIVYANEYAPKPSSKVFEEYIVKLYNVEPKKVLMIGDSKADEGFAKEIGSFFINIIDL
jgi:FMN phosphatase YigB (HAD superfamily)